MSPFPVVMVNLSHPHRRVLHAVRPDVALLAIHGQHLHVELERDAREIRHRQRLQAQVVVVIVGAEELDVREVLGRLEDAGNVEAGLSCVADRGGRRAAGVSLQLDGPAGIEHVEGFGGHEIGLIEMDGSPHFRHQRGVSKYGWVVLVMT
jgi:hypothetical protein